MERYLFAKQMIGVRFPVVISFINIIYYYHCIDNFLHSSMVEHPAVNRQTLVRFQVKEYFK